ncbi:MAG: DUF6488 family protein [Campylobacterota bacterium]|nr:DUF6488 family protein [Campylobacterota bacterium]
MKLIKIFIMAILLTCSFTSLNAHGTHKHAEKKAGVTETVANDIAKVYLKKLIKEAKVESSWSKSSIINSEKKMFHKHKEWVVSFGNDSMKDVEKKILYIFVGMDAKVTGANYTGN